MPVSFIGLKAEGFESRARQSANSSQSLNLRVPLQGVYRRIYRTYGGFVGLCRAQIIGP